MAVSRMPLKEAVARVMDGTFRDGKTIVGIMMAAAALAETAEVLTHPNE